MGPARTIKAFSGNYRTAALVTEKIFEVVFGFIGNRMVIVFMEIVSRVLNCN